DEPLLMGQLVRMALQNITIDKMERALANGQARAKTLAEARLAFAAWAREDLFVIGMRGERAGFHLLFTNLLNGSVHLAELAGPGARATWWDNVHQGLAGNMLRESHIYALRHLTRAIEATKLPCSERAHLFSHMELELKEGKVTGEIPKIA